jgi:hypothetical protein
MMIKDAHAAFARLNDIILQSIVFFFFVCLNLFVCLVRAKFEISVYRVLSTSASGQRTVETSVESRIPMSAYCHV